MKKTFLVFAMVFGLAVSAFANTGIDFEPFNVLKFQTIEEINLDYFNHFVRFNAYRNVKKLGNNLYKYQTWDSIQVQYIIVL